MNPPAADWQGLFDELVELSGPARAARLAELQRSDAALAAELDALLRADAGEALVPKDLDASLPPLPAHFVARALDLADRLEPPADRRGERVGAWRLVSPLGRGGTAEVYLAERVDGEYDQQVALKLVRTEVGSAELHRRFLRERRILAQLDHPGIARLLDGGTTAAGEPYFVLELVRGRRITDHCEMEGLSLASRLGLFVDVCEAVDAAHRRLVVHRDLKPSNILVTPEGTVKLLDFGIAKLLDAEAEEDAPSGSAAGPLTRIAAQPLTPSYAAPEQILDEPISTATDVFALGILLYELVVGWPPFERPVDSRGALARAVGSELLVAPSAAVRRGVAASGDRAPLARLGEVAERDLDTVAARALAREPQRRYRSAAALADDVRNLVARRPVAARPDSLRYRASRFVDRNRSLVTLAALALVALATLLVVALVQGEAARREARRASRVQQFLVEMFRDSDPSRTRSATLTARELVTTAATRIERAFGDEPGIAGDLDDAIAQVETGLGLAEEAAARARRAVALRTATAGANAVPALRAQVTLAEALFAQGDLVGADAAVAAAGPLRGSAGEESAVDRMFAVEAEMRSQQGRADEALAIGREALAGAERRFGAEAVPALLWRARLAGMLCDASRVSEAISLLRPVLPALRSRAHGDPLRLAEARLLAGEALDLGGDGETGGALLRSGVGLLRETLGPDHPEVALAEIKLGYLLFEQHDLAAAESTLEHAATVLGRIDHYEAGSARRYLGLVHLEMGDAAAALADFEAAEKIFRASGEQASIYTNSARLSRAYALLHLGRLAEAEALLRDIEAQIEAGAPGGEYILRTAIKYLGEVRRQRGDPEEALALHRRARALEVDIFGTEDHPTVAMSDYEIALDLLARRDRAALAEARVSIDRAVAFQRRAEPSGARLGEFLVASARIAAAQGAVARAKREAGEGRDLLLAVRGPAHPTTRDAEAFLALMAHRRPATSVPRRR